MWTRINHSLNEHWILNRNGLSVCSLKRDIDGWTASILNFGGISSTEMHLTSKSTTDQAKLACELELARKGWSWR